MDWIEIFKTGTHTDGYGQTREWTDKDLEEIVSLYDSKDPAPIVIGHPETDSPAYGWIEALKVEGDKLLAKPGQVVEEFKDWVRKGLYKKISIALNDNMGLRHIGFLGGRAPAIKGLKPASFGKGKAVWTFEMEMPCLPIEHTERQDSIENSKKGGHAMEKFKAFIDGLKSLIGGVEKDFTVTDGGHGHGYSEAEVQAREAKAKKDAETFAFAEAEKKIETEKKAKEEAEKKLREIETKARKDAIASFCEAQCKEGKLTPALRKLIEPAMIFAATHEGTIQFSETEKKAPVEILKDFMKALPKLVEFSEFAGKDKEIPTEFEGLVKKTMEEKKLSRAKAIEFCAKEYPEKHDEYVANLKK